VCSVVEQFENSFHQRSIAYQGEMKGTVEGSDAAGNDYQLMVISL
jgi:hypothetical protein